jgi:PPOX class probable F420-dependent enzyme
VIEDRIAELARSTALASVTTLLPDGTPMTHPLWVDTDGEHILLNTEVHRRKYRNVERDPRVTVMIVDPKNPYAYVEVRGTVTETVTGSEARAHIDALAQKYTGQNYAGTIQSERVILKITPTRQRVR